LAVFGPAAYCYRCTSVFEVERAACSGRPMAHRSSDFEASATFGVAFDHPKRRRSGKQSMAMTGDKNFTPRSQEEASRAFACDADIS